MIRARVTLSLALAIGGCDSTTPQPEPPVSTSTATLLTAQRYLDAGQFDQSEAILVAAMKSWPHDPSVHELLARVDFGRGLQFHRGGLIDRGDAALSDALVHWRTACDLVPNAAPMRVSAGDVAAMIGRQDEARVFYAAALEIDPSSGRAALCLAQLEMEEHPQLARELLQQALTHAGEVPEVHASLALLHARADAPEAAREAIARAVELGPELQAVRVMQARIERLLGNPTRGVEILSALGPKAAGDRGVAWEAAACWTAIDRPDRVAEAWVTCFLANAHRTDAGELAANAARAFTAAGDAVHAETWWRQARLLGVHERVDQSPEPASEP